MKRLAAGLLIASLFMVGCGTAKTPTTKTTTTTTTATTTTAK